MVDLIALAQAGSAAILLAGIVAIIRGDLVPGHIYRREIARGDRNDALLVEVGTLLRDLVAFVKLPPRDGSKDR